MAAGMVCMDTSLGSSYVLLCGSGLRGTASTRLGADMPFRILSVIQVRTTFGFATNYEMGGRHSPFAIKYFTTYLSAYGRRYAGAHFTRSPPERNSPGIIVAAVSVVVMPMLARAKRRDASGIGSGAMQADSRQRTSARTSQ
jgi:hypothetical protein